MANPQVDNLIAELGGLLEQNRQKRNAADAMMLGIAQGKQRAQMEQNNANQLKTAISSGYGGDKAYSHKGTQASAATLSPSTTGKGRVGIAEEYARSQGNIPNPYTQPGGKYQFLEENAPPAPPPQDAGALEEQKKRFTQNLMLSRGETGGPLGGAGAAPEPIDPAVSAAMRPQASPADAAALQAAGNPDLGNFGHIVADTQNKPLGGISSSYGGDKAYSMKGTSPAASAISPSTTAAGRAGGMPPDDYALLEALAQRYRSPEELAGR